MNVLGIHDGLGASAGLIQNGNIVKAVSEERFTQKKNDVGFPYTSLQYIKEDLSHLDIIAIPWVGGSALIRRFIPVYEEKRRLLITQRMREVVQHIWDAIRFENKETIEPIFDSDRPIRSTGDMRTWYTGRPCEFTKKSHINFCVYDSRWEASEAFELDRNENVEAWVKNDHLGFEIIYVYEGVVRKYRPDFIIRLKNGEYLVLETKGRETQRDKEKYKYLKEWIRAVNEQGSFGKWHSAISKTPTDLQQILKKFT